MVNAVILHTAADRRAAAAVSNVLPEVSTFTSEVTPGAPPLAVGVGVVAVAIWSISSGGEAEVAALVESVELAPGRAILFVFGGAETPSKLANAVTLVLNATANGEADALRLQQEIIALAPRRAVKSEPQGAFVDVAAPSHNRLGIFAFGLVIGLIIGVLGALHFTHRAAIAPSANVTIPIGLHSAPKP